MSTIGYKRQIIRSLSFHSPYISQFFILNIIIFHHFTKSKGVLEVGKRGKALKERP